MAMSWLIGFPLGNSRLHGAEADAARAAAMLVDPALAGHHEVTGAEAVRAGRARRR
jgi:hypothetical protein